MKALARWRAGAVVLIAVGALMPLALARQARGRSARALAARDATAAAAYLTIVTPSPPRGGAGYDLPQLLIRARALGELPGFSGRFEIYHATAPLVLATAPPLAAATLQRLRLEVAVRWTGEAALAPMLDREGWDVVGAVAARPAAGIWPLSPWSLGALLLLLVAAARSVAAIGTPRRAWRDSLGPYGLVAALFGVAVFAELRGAAGDATDEWLYDTRLLMQEAAARIPEVRSVPASLATLARGPRSCRGTRGQRRHGAALPAVFRERQWPCGSRRDAGSSCGRGPGRPARPAGCRSCSAWRRSVRSACCSPRGAPRARRGRGAKRWPPGHFSRPRRSTSPRSASSHSCWCFMFRCIVVARSSR